MTLRASGSASSIALDRSERATVPGWTWSLSARRASFSACSSSRVMFSRSTTQIVHETLRAVHILLPRVAESPGPRPRPASLPAVSSPIAATGPLVQQGSIAFRLLDPDAELAGVRLATDRGFPIAAEPFARDGDAWTLRMPAPALDRFEYALAVQRADGSHEHWTDPANPLRAPGAFGEKSVVQLPGYAEPTWLGAERVPGATDALTVASSALGAELRIALW